MNAKQLIFWSVLAIITTIILVLFVNFNANAEKDSNEDWPMFRLNLLHSGYKEGRAPNSNVTDWIFEIPPGNRWIVSSPMIVDDYVYFGCDNGKLYKLNCKDGSLIWSYKASNGGYATFWSSPCVDKEKGMVFINVRGIHAIDINTGELIWRYDTQETREFSSPVVHNGVVFFGSNNHHVYAVPEDDPNSDGVIDESEVIWYYETGEYENGVRIEGTGGAVSATVAIHKGMVFCAEQTRYSGDQHYCDYNVFALPEDDPNGNGVIEHSEIIWKYKIGEHLPIGDVHVPFTGGDIFSSPSVHGDVLYIGSNDQYVYALDINGDNDGLDNDGDGIVDNEGKLIWKFDVGDEVFSTPSYHNGKVIFGCGGEDQEPASIYALPEVDPNGDGIIEKDEIIWRFTIDDRSLVSPLIADGKIFTGSNDRKIYALDEKDGTLIWSYETGNYIGSSPSLYKEKIYVGSCDSKLYTFKIVNSKPHVYLLYPKFDDRVPDTVVLKWRGRDWDKGDQEKLTYDVYLDTDYKNVENSANTSLVSEGQKDESFKPIVEEGKKYYWKVVANDTELEEVSSISRFYVNIKPKISAFSPADNGRITSNKTRLSWKGEDGDDDEIFYDVYFGDNALPNNVSNEQKDEYFDVSDLEIGKRYYWKIVAKDGIDNVSSSILTFIVNTPPVISLISPKNSEKLDSVILKWHGRDNDSDGLTYDIYLDKNSNPTTKIADDITTEFYEVYNLEEGEKYYWKVVVSDSYEKIDSEIWSFVLNNKPKINLVNPENGAKILENYVILSWEGSDEDNDNLTYDLYFGKEIENESIIWNISEESYEIYGLEEGQIYYWKVVVNDVVSKVCSEIWSFKTNSPPIIELISPYNGKKVSSDSIKLSWKGEDKDYDYLLYDVYFDKNTIPNKIVSANLENEFLEVEGLEKGVSYYWRVVVKDGFIEKSSEIRYIVVNSPPKITLISPLDEEEIDDTNVRLSWSAVDNENDDLRFDVYLDKKISPAIKVSKNQSKDYFDLENLERGETYYWKIIAYDGYEKRFSEIWEFSIKEEITLLELSISSDDIIFSKTMPNEDDEIIITVNVHNDGKENLKGVKVYIFDGNPINALLIYEETVLIDADSFKTVKTSWIATEGIHNIYVLVEYEGSSKMAFKTINVKKKVVEKEEEKFEMEWLALPSIIAVVIAIGLIGVKSSKKHPKKRCPECGLMMEYVKEERDYYCYECEEYLEDM